jgi:predicted Fe-Mo cluster-binding NifX family protein
MKILFTTDGDTLESKIAKRFGEAKFYLVYDMETKGITAQINEGHDDNHSSLIKLAEEGVITFIVGNCGPNAFKVLKEHNARLFLARMMTAKDALEKFNNNELKELLEPTLKQTIDKHRA